MPLVENSWLTTFDCGVRPGENVPRLAELWAIVEQKLCPPGGQAVSDKSSQYAVRILFDLCLGSVSTSISS